jgi:transposase
MAARRGGLVANIALARKLAALFWRVMVNGMDYVELGLQQYEAKVLETKQRSLRRLARQLGQRLVPMTTPAPAKGPSANNATS